MVKQVTQQKQGTKAQAVSPTRTVSNQNNRKFVQIFVEKGIEFQIDFLDDPVYTCGWLQAEVVRKYYEFLE